MTDIPDWYRAVTARAAQEAPQVPTATVLATEYTVNCLPDDDVNSFVFQVRVQYRGEGRYAVIRGGDMCLGSDGTWDHGVKEYDRGNDWLNAHRFDLDTALRLAKEQAALVTVNGHTVTDALNGRERRVERHA
ncbi:hypothetical protein P1P75_40675 [Streptomyces sp. ID05-39B]|uniref:hypothetical protein n=1 Tax=Streptomyces sp. ID05-39B TaxID=3028664 RepID=UPI0029BEE987|nr:hypothetical protein [Streptomyces sp. ID05-39B]MDX3532545.1 hypothetical protein [Streptomyces sp. ID05-39B]